MKDYYSKLNYVKKYNTLPEGKTYNRTVWGRNEDFIAVAPMEYGGGARKEMYLAPNGDIAIYSNDGMWANWYEAPKGE